MSTAHEDLTVLPGINQTIISYVGQKVFHLNNYYPNNGDSLVVTVDGVLQHVGSDYVEWDGSYEDTNGTVTFNEPMEKGKVVTFTYTKTATRRFLDVSSSDWFSEMVLEYEDLILEDGTYLLDPVSVTTVGEDILEKATYQV